MESKEYKNFEAYQRFHINGWASSYLAVGMTWLVGAILGLVLQGKAGELLLTAPVDFGRWLRELSLSGGNGNITAWAILLGVSALPLLGLFWKGRQKADLLLPLTACILGIWLFYLVNPTMLNTYLPVTEGWGLCGLAAAGSLMVAWVVLRLMKTLDGGAWRLLPKILHWGAVVYALFLGMSTVQQSMFAAEAVQAANTANPEIASFTANTMENLAIWKCIPSLAATVLVMWGGDLLQALESEPFAEDTVALAEAIAGRCGYVVGITLFVTVYCNLTQMFRFSRLANVDVEVYIPVMTLVLAAVLRTLCRYFRRAKAVSDDNDTII